MPDTQETLNAMAAEIFDLYRLIAVARSRRPTGPDELSESEFITLDLLVKEEPLTIGDAQKRIGVVPAQMSRIIRALEEHGGKGFVECSINPNDRRRVDITLTRAGREAHRKFMAARLGSMHEVLVALDPEDRRHFMRIMGVLKNAFEKRLDEN